MSSSADLVAKEKAPVQNCVMNSVLALEVVQKSISEYSHTSFEDSDLENILTSKLEEYDMYLSMLKYGTDSDKFHQSKAGQLYKKLNITNSVPKGSESIQKTLKKVLKESSVFSKNSIIYEVLQKIITYNS